MAAVTAFTIRAPSVSTRGRLPARRQQIRVRSRASSKGPETPRPQAPETATRPNPLQQIKTSLTQVSERYDILSTSAGALVCTTFFWSRGQDPFEALWITICATVAGLVINELLFDNEQ